MPEQRISDELNQPDVDLEVSLRPSLFSDFTGQAKVKERLIEREQALTNIGMQCTVDMNLRPINTLNKCNHMPPLLIDL